MAAGKEVLVIVRELVRLTAKVPMTLPAMSTIALLAAAKVLGETSKSPLSKLPLKVTVAKLWPATWLTELMVWPATVPLSTNVKSPAAKLPPAAFCTGSLKLTFKVVLEAKPLTV